MLLLLSRRLMIVALTTVAAATLPSAGHAEDKLLTEAVQFNGTILYLSTKVPGLIFGAVRNGETAFAGFGEIADGSDKVPGGDTMFRIASVSKVFCGSVLSSLVIDGKVQLTDRLQDRLGYDVTLPEKDGRALRLVDLVTQASGLPREVPRPDAPPNDPFSTNTKEAQIAALKEDRSSSRRAPRSFIPTSDMISSARRSRMSRASPMPNSFRSASSILSG